MSKIEFGFDCGEFSIAVSGNDVLLPGSKNQPLKKTLIPAAALNDTAGVYLFRAECDGQVICEVPVHVLWVTHKSQAQPFIGIRPELEKAEDMRARFTKFIGKRVSLRFIPKQPVMGHGVN